MNLLQEEPFQSFDTAITEALQSFGAIGLLPVAREDPIHKPDFTSVGYVFRQIETNKLLKLSVVRIEGTDRCSLNSYILTVDGKSLPVRDYLRVHPELGFSENVFLLQSNDGPLQERAERLIQILTQLLRGPLEPFLRGYAWEQVSPDFQGWK